MNLTPELWEEWRANPITAWFFEQFLRDEVTRTKQIAMADAWACFQQPTEHAGLRNRAETLAWLGTMTYGDIQHAIANQQEMNDEWRTHFPK